MLCRDSGLPHDARILWVLQETFFERLLAREGRTSTLFNNSKNLATSQELRPDLTGKTKRPEIDMRREPQNSSILVPRFQSRGGLLHHTGGTFSHGDMMDYTGFPISELHVGIILIQWNFQAGKSTSKLKYVQNQQKLISQCTGSKKLRWQSQLTNLRHHVRL